MRGARLGQQPAGLTERLSFSCRRRVASSSRYAEASRSRSEVASAPDSVTTRRDSSIILRMREAFSSRVAG